MRRLILLLTLPLALATLIALPGSHPRPPSTVAPQDAAPRAGAQAPATAITPVKVQDSDPCAGGGCRVAALPTLTPVGHTDLGGTGFTANVRALDGYAYVGSWGTGGSCPALGVRVVDLADPTAPQVVAVTAKYPQTTAEDVAPTRMATPDFTGAVLAVGIQRCNGLGAAGLALIDITDPVHPVELSFLSTGPGPRGVHELAVTVSGRRAIALLATPYSEPYGQGDLRIVDISDPRRPRQIASWGAQRDAGITAGVGCATAVYDHSVSASADGTRAYLAYWDAGVIALDISDPGAPRFLYRLALPEAEGSVHSVVEGPDGHLTVTIEDDVFRAPRGLRLSAMAGGMTVDVPACEVDGSRPLDAAGVSVGPMADLGALCRRRAPAGGAVALIDEGGCPLPSKVRRAMEAGAVAIIVVNAGPDAGRDDSAGGLLPVVGVSAADGSRLRQTLVAGPVTVALPSARPWGGVELWDVCDPERPAVRSVFRRPRRAVPARRPAHTRCITHSWLVATGCSRGTPTVCAWLIWPTPPIWSRWTPLCHRPSPTRTAASHRPPPYGAWRSTATWRWPATSTAACHLLRVSSLTG
ncbi:MAG: PA domain-containing protein [Dehalococcoidia bacterium]